MKRKITHKSCILRLLTVFCFGAILLSSCVKTVTDKIEWASSLTDALKTAQEQNKHIIAEFWMDG